MKSLILLYNDLLHLNYIIIVIQYCSNIWGNTFRSSLKNIFILQKRAIKYISNNNCMHIMNVHTISNSLKFDYFFTDIQDRNLIIKYFI